MTHNVVALSGLSEIRPGSVTLMGPSMMPQTLCGLGEDSEIPEPVIRLNPYVLTVGLLAAAAAIACWRRR